jgi:cyclopropane fatty-acyl-phospholipid synthase-like methyltransferase
MRTVDSNVYTKKYYLSDCNHYQEFVRSGGKELGDRFEQLLPYLNIQPGMKILDVGSGRGELCFYAATLGAEVTGVDYSKAAIDLANEAKAKLSKPVQKRLQFIKVPVTEMNFPDNFFDLVICVEVLEHLYPEEIGVMLASIYKSLKVEGRAVFHTAPNKWFNDVGYRFWSYPMGNLTIRLSNLFTGNTYPLMQNPQTLRTDSHKIMHVNEPTWFSLKHEFSNQDWEFYIQSMNITMIKPVLSWKDAVFNAIAYFHPLSKKFPFNMMFGDDFLVLARKRK